MAKLGIVLATYNEANSLPRLIERLEGLSLSLELRILVVDDNSPDGTSGIAEQLASRYGNISVITRPGKLGLGSALRDGMRAALADGCSLILNMDADLSHSPEDVPRLLAAAETAGVDLVQASRYAKGGRTEGLGWRRLQGRLANLLCRWLLGSPREATTNFRIFSRKSAELVVAESRGRDFEFQPECILIAMRHGLRIEEVPITFTGRGEGKSKLRITHYTKWAAFFIGAFVSVRLGIGRFARVGSGPGDRPG